MVVVIIITMFNCSLVHLLAKYYTLQGGIVIIMIMFNLHVYLVINWVLSSAHCNNHHHGYV